MRKLFGLAILLALVGSSWAATVDWDGGGDGCSWIDNTNWKNDVLPGSLDTAIIRGTSPDPGNSNVSINNTQTGTCAILSVAQNDTATVTVNTGGTLTVAGNAIRVGWTSNTGYFNISGGTVTASAGSLEVGKNDGQGEVVQSAGSAAYKNMYLGEGSSSSKGSYYLNGGSVTTGWLSGKGGNFYYEQTAGCLTASQLRLNYSTGSGELHLDGGTMHTTGNLAMNGSRKMDITGGTLTLADTDQVDYNNILTYVSNGWITGYDFADLNHVIVSWDEASEVTTVTAAVPEPATISLLCVGGLALVQRRRR